MRVPLFVFQGAAAVRRVSTAPVMPLTWAFTVKLKWKATLTVLP